MAALAGGSAFAQVGTKQSTILQRSERSEVFHESYEQEIENSLGGIRSNRGEAFDAEQLQGLQRDYATEYSQEESLLSLNLFRSLAAYLRERTYQTQSLNDQVLEESAPASRVYTETSLLSALEFYAHNPLRREDVEAGLGRLTSIIDINAASAAVQPEIRFWIAEGYRSLGEFAQAEREYHESLVKSSDPRLTALTQFRLGELYEREARFAAADSSFNATAHIPESPLVLLAMLRRAAVLRSEKQYDAVLQQLDALQSAAESSSTTIRTSARDFHYVSPLVEQLTLHTTESDRIVGSAPNDGLLRVYGRSTYQLSSPYLTSEIALVRGSALSELQEYEKATNVLTEGENAIARSNDSLGGKYLNDQARFVSNALKFEKGWSLFQRAKYDDAAIAFLQLAAEDTAHRHRLIRESIAPLRDQGAYFDDFLNDTLLASKAPTLDNSVLARNTIDTSFFFYNDFPERARFYAGVALARAGKRQEAAQVFVRLAQDKGVLYSDRANYQLALIRFAEHNYEARPLLEPLSFERSLTGAYASFLLGELAYRRELYEQADRYFYNSFANIPPTDTAILATAHLERGLSLVVLKNWPEAANELLSYLRLTPTSKLGMTDEALYWLGIADQKSKQPDSAEQAFNRLLTEFPKSPRTIDAQYSYAWSLFQQNDFINAEQAFEKVIALDSISRYSYDALARAGDSYYATNKLLDANHLYNQAIDRPAFNDLRTTRALLQLGVTRMALDSERSAMGIFDYLARKYPKSDIVDGAYFNSALAAYSINLIDKAEQNVAYITTNFRQSPVASRALFVAAEERVRHNDTRNALPYYQRVLNDYPSSAEAGVALANLQEALISLKRTNDALAVADSFVSQNPSSPLNPGILLHSGELKLRFGSPAQALQTIQQFITTYPTNPLLPYAQLLATRAEAATGDTATALSGLASIIHSYDTSLIASSAYLDRARLERKQGDPFAAEQDYLAASADRFFSSDASPAAMTELADLYVDQQKPDSAIIELQAIADKYPVESGVSARALIRASDLMVAASRFEEARSVLGQVVKAHPKDMLGGAATVEIGATYAAQSQWKLAVDAYTSAKKNFSLTGESEGNRLLGLAEAYHQLKMNSNAIRELRQLLEARGITESDKSRGRSLLSVLAPPQKAKKPTKKRGSK